MKTPITGQYVSAGDLDRVISLISLSSTLNEFGEPTPSQSVTETMRARRATFVSSDYARMQTTGAVADVRYEIRYRDGIKVGMMIREDSTNYYIVAVEEIGRRRGLSITCKVAS